MTLHSQRRQSKVYFVCCVNLKLLCLSSDSIDPWMTIIGGANYAGVCLMVACNKTAG